MKSVELDELNRKFKSFSYGKIPQVPNKDIIQLADPHIDSFNFFIESLPTLSESIKFHGPNGDKISFTIEDVSLGKPLLPLSSSEMGRFIKYPKECKAEGSTYKGQLTASLQWSLDDVMQEPLTCILGDIPIMVKSVNCNLYKMSPEELVKHGELVNETGGYFIINGICRILRMLITTRRNYPIALTRNVWKSRDVNFSGKGVMINCVTRDQRRTENILHYLLTGGVKLEMRIQREAYFIPLMMVLKVLMNYSDQFIYFRLIQGRDNDKYFSEKVKMMMRQLQEMGYHDQLKCRQYIGSLFRERFTNYCPVSMSHEAVCDFLFDQYVLSHLDTAAAKFETLCMMTRKLFAYVGDHCCAESPDDISMQEASLPGHIFLQLIQSKITLGLQYMKKLFLYRNKDKDNSESITSANVSTIMKRSLNIGSRIQSFIATGNLPFGTHHILMQNSGLTITLEHLNRLRDMSYFRAIHRGSFFLGMKSIEPRRLSGAAWGFICPVQTPDGAPCGLLNHLAFHCIIPCKSIPNDEPLIQALVDLGMTPVNSEPLHPYLESLEVVLNGAMMGYIGKIEAANFVFQLRMLKVHQQIPQYTELVLIEESDRGQYPGLFIISSVARLMRPVVNLELSMIEYVGTLEQTFLNIAVSPDDIEKGVHTHMDIEKIAMLSNVARLVPFSDCNPNPRNMYQCQMAKQTMGMPIHNWPDQSLNKLYRLQYSQVPLVRNAHYDRMGMDEFSIGFNAILAVVSYTGYDMEDAMIINKGSMERGLAHGFVYKSEFVDLGSLTTKRRRGLISNEISHIFQRDLSNPQLGLFLDTNGLPFPGTKLTEGDPFYCIYNITSKTYQVTKYSGETCCVDKYSIIHSSNKSEIQRVCITLRVRRDPLVGDKFASRSGQKGILSRLYPTEDLPFSERGIVPDIIFNPHGIPSRMTAGTLIELVAGKSAAEFGKAFDSSPFQFDDENPAFDYFGQILEKAGFNYYGEDVLYSGTDGRMMEVEIFEGIIYYQRLRHMTADKWQVRSTGPCNVTTHQPVKGRSKGGAIRFGEMERDCLISHGAAFTLKDRLLDCSDTTAEWVCTRCRSALSSLVTISSSKHSMQSPQCLACGPDAHTRMIRIPFAFKYLIAELSSVGIKTEINIESAEDIMRQSLYPVIKAGTKPNK